jgi:chloramphenicol 3-O-phosphotransferase
VVIVVTGVMAAGKSTVAQRLAERLPRAVHIRGDVFRRMIVTGRAEPTPEGLNPAAGGPAEPSGRASRDLTVPPGVSGSTSGTGPLGASGTTDAADRPGGGGATDPGEARRQLDLRYRLSAQVADAYADAGFVAVVQDVILGPDLPAYAEMVRTRPCHLVVLAPRPEVVARRDAQRRKTGYADGWTVDGLATALDETPRIGLWVDNSDLTVEQTVALILSYVT